MRPEVIAYCRTLDSADIGRLPFRKQIFPEMTNAMLAGQAVLQKMAEKKLPPEWLKKNLLMPDRQAIEQCTSALVAAWKKEIIPPDVSLLADAAAGLGADAFFFGESVGKLLLFEADEVRVLALRYNAPLLFDGHADVRHGFLSESELEDLSKNNRAFLLYADPDRRTEEGLRKIHWTDCSPDVRIFHRILKNSGSRMLVKFSPLDDPEEIIAQLPGATEVFLVSVHNEVKEVLVYWDFSAAGATRFRAFDLRRDGAAQSTIIPVQLPGRPMPGEALAGMFLLDPYAALRKGRLAACLAEEQGWKQLSAKARLFITENKPTDFPGRVFGIVAVHTSPSAFRKNFTGNACHLVARDFPVSTEDLRKSLKLREEGEDFLFCFSNENGGRRVIHARRC